MPSGRYTRRQGRRQQGRQQGRKLTSLRKNKKKRTAILQPGPEGCHPRIGKKKPTNGCFPTSVRRRLMTRKEKGGGTSSSGKENQCLKNHTSDRCLLEQSSLSDEAKETLSKKYLRPKRPSAWASDPDQWLDSNNIESVMKQYEEAYPDFKFLGVLPIDFAAPDPYKSNGKTCLVDSICQLKLPDLKADGIYRLGAVFNLDPHFKDGSH